jgi:hypothetical protein
MSDWFPEPVTGDDRCPKCEGKKVQKVKDTKPRQDCFAQYLWYGESAYPLIWCEACGGSGLATDAMIRLLEKS